MRVGDLVAGRYRLDQPIGSGGMAVVWRATDVELGRVVALKRALPGAGERAAPQMRDEARIAAGLHHPHVVTLFDILVEGAERWLVMEYLPSRSLAQLRNERGALLPMETARIGAQIADALDAVHRRDIVHGDVTPGNVLVAENGTAKLTDFGISRALWNEVTLTDDGAVCGTPAYLAPEVADGYHPESASDVFSLGATLFAAVEGASPYGTSPDPHGLVERARAGRINPARHAGPLTPALSAMLQVDPRRRPDAAEARRLLRVAAGLPAELPDGDQRKPGRRRLHVALTIVGLVAVGGSLLVASIVQPPPSLAGAAHGQPTLGRATSAPPPTPGFGDPRTADPCSLVGVTTFANYGKAALKTDNGNFNRCDVIVLSPRSSVDIEAELLNAGNDDQATQGQVSTVGQLRVVRLPLDNDTCERKVYLPDHTLVDLQAKQNGVSGSADLCALADAATTPAVAVLTKGPLPRRSAPFPAASAAKLDACTLLDAAALTRIPGIDIADPVPGFGNWVCAWNNADNNGTSIKVYFDRNGPLDSSDGRPTRVGGRATFVQPDAQDTLCTAKIVFRSYADDAGQPTEDLVNVEVNGAGPAARLCTTATTLAGDVVPKLPAP